MSVRVYVPTTLAGLRTLVETGELAGVDGVLPDGDEEEVEYAALMQAAEESTTLLDGPGRRVVVVAELADADAAITLRDVVSVHVDPADRPADADPDEDLGWYATQEIDRLLEA